MEIGWLEDFVALCEVGNFSRAAEHRNLTQPAFSRHIQSLENWVGAPLFDRGRQPIRPTAAGQALLPAAETVLHHLQRAREQAQAAGAGESVTLHFAATHSLSLTFFPQWIRGLEDVRRPFPIRLDSDTMQACETLLSQRYCHFLLCHADPGTTQRLDPRVYDSQTVGHDALVPVVRADLRDSQPWLSGTPDDMVPFLAYSEVSALGRAVQRRLGNSAGPPPALACRFTSHLAIVLRSMVLDGQGLAWLPLTLIGSDLDSGTLAAVGGDDWRIPLDVTVFRSRETLGPDIERFWHRLADGAAAPA